MDALDPAARYREYLRSFGIAEAGDRVAELRDLDSGPVRFFAYAGGEGLRLKAVVTPNGLVAPGGQAGDDWHGFLSGVSDAATAAERIAWLETDDSSPPHGLPGAPTIALAPDRPPPAGIDPAQWAFVTAPALTVSPGGGVTLTAWLLPGGGHVPTRWTVSARAGTPAVIERVAASDLLLESAEAAAARARRLLAAGTEGERWWALQHIGDTDDHGAIPDLAVLLADRGTSPSLKIQVAGTLARLVDTAAVPSLSAALRTDDAPEVRRACAQALGRIPGADAVRALKAAAPDEPEVTVRAEIGHALAAQGHPAPSFPKRGKL
jgi:hypothetical protein